MCNVLKLPRSTYYYESTVKNTKDAMNEDVIRIFNESRKNYGTRKIKKKLADDGKIVSRRRIGRIMRENGLVSTYTIAQYKPHA